MHRKAVLPESAAETLCRVITKALDLHKATDIQVIDLHGKTEIADYMVVASGTSGRHLESMAQKVADAVRASKMTTPQIEGDGHSDWVLVDTPFVIVHLFRPEARAHYGLEKMWSCDMQASELVS